VLHRFAWPSLPVWGGWQQGSKHTNSPFIRHGTTI
jgi:hypothetical protein